MSESLQPADARSAVGNREVSETTQPSTGRHDVIGSVLFALLGVAVIVLSFYYSAPGGFYGAIMWVRIFCAAVAILGALVALGILPVRNPQDYYGGLALLGLAVFAVVASLSLPGMRGFAFGPGTAPRLFAYILAGLGLLIAAMGVVTDGPKIDPYRVRGPVFITASILLFGACVRPLGLVVASFLCIISCALAAEDIKWKETLIWAVILTAFCSVLFPYGLNLPFQLWPRF
jgi:putative tricarboxylic transport membrane protein